ncbi:hypothetical protein D3C86_606700 [compost metagenome]
MLIPSINTSLDELIRLLDQLSDQEYSKSCSELSNASIGEHTRHIIEMFQCLENQYESGVVNYDKRDRNVQIQTAAKFAIAQIVLIKDNLEKENKNIELQQIVDGEEIRIQSNYHRELLYNLEHCIHHPKIFLSMKILVLPVPQSNIESNVHSKFCLFR